MKKVRITASRTIHNRECSAIYQTPTENAFSINDGDSFVAIDAKCPDGFCQSAWQSILPFVEPLACGKGNFFDGWMKNPYSALISCNDGFRPVSFLLETIEE